jgi:hypothetical protein
MKKYLLIVTAIPFVGLTMCTSENSSTEIEIPTRNVELTSGLIKDSVVSMVETDSGSQDSITEIKKVKTDSVENNLSIEFEKIKVGPIPNYDSVMHVLKATNLKSICQDKKVDQLDIDIMFMKTAILPFDQFKITELSDGLNRSYRDLFPEKELMIFYNEARAFLKRRSKRNNG